MSMEDRDNFFHSFLPLSLRPSIPPPSVPLHCAMIAGQRAAALFQLRCLPASFSSSTFPFSFRFLPRYSFDFILQTANRGSLDRDNDPWIPLLCFLLHFKAKCCHVVLKDFSLYKGENVEVCRELVEETIRML